MRADRSLRRCDVANLAMIMALSAIVNTLCYNLIMRATSVKRPERKAKPFAQAVPPAPPSLKARKQQVVRAALSAAAEELFLARGFEKTTVEQVARAAGVSRRTFFRYYESKEDVLVERSDRLGEQLLAELAARPRSEPPLLAIRNALVPAVEAGLVERALVRSTIRLMRETSTLRRAMMEHRNRLEERIAALMARRLGTARDDNTPLLLAFVTRALHDSAFNAWYDHETDDIAGLVDDLVGRLCAIVAAMPAKHAKPRK
jgi:AcrR family transcriptional regulator